MGGWNGYDLRALAWTVRILFGLHLQTKEADTAPQWQNASIATASRVPGVPLYKSLQEALSSMQPRALVMPTRTDQYFVVCLCELCELAARLTHYALLSPRTRRRRSNFYPRDCSPWLRPSTGAWDAVQRWTFLTSWSRSHVGGGGGGSKADNDFIDAKIAKFLAV